MSFFSNFPVVQYNFENGEYPIVITHILRRFKFRESLSDSVQVYDNYLVSDNENPENVAYYLYGKPEYHWIVLMFNDIIDPFTEWVKNQEALNAWIEDNYADKDGIHHYEKNGKRVPQGTSGASVVTNYEYEYRLNEARRKIKVPKSEHISSIIKEVNTILSERI